MSGYPMKLDDFSAFSSDLELDRLSCAEVEPCPDCGETFLADIIGRRVMYHCASCDMTGSCDLYGRQSEDGLEEEFEDETVTLHSKKSANRNGLVD